MATLLTTVCCSDLSNTGTVVTPAVIGSLTAKLGTNGLIRDQRYQTDHDAGLSFVN